MIPLWKHPVVALDIRTTGADPENQEICRLVAIKLNSEFKPAADYPKLNLTILPDCPGFVNASYLTKTCMPIEQLMLTGCSQADAYRMWEDWRGKMPMLVLAYRWHRMLPFLTRFTGSEFYVEPIRDLMTYAVYMHDRHWFAQYNPGFTSFTRKKIYEICGVPCFDIKNPMMTCLADLDCFRRLLTHPLP